LQSEDEKDYWVIGEDILEEEAVEISAEIRFGLDGKRHIWVADIYPD
jgi:hypothetical protein